MSKDHCSSTVPRAVNLTPVLSDGHWRRPSPISSTVAVGASPEAEPALRSHAAHVLYTTLEAAKSPEEALQEARRLLGGVAVGGDAVRARGNDGNTAALHLAIVQHKSPALVELLCKAGADVNFYSQVMPSSASLKSYDDDCDAVNGIV